MQKVGRAFMTPHVLPPFNLSSRANCKKSAQTKPSWLFGHASDAAHARIVRHDTCSCMLPLRGMLCTRSPAVIVRHCLGGHLASSQFLAAMHGVRGSPVSQGCFKNITFPVSFQEGKQTSSWTQPWPLRQKLAPPSGTDSLQNRSLKGTLPYNCDWLGCILVH